MRPNPYLAVAVAPLLLLTGLPAQADDPTQTATGVVFHDADGDQTRDADEEGIAGVVVSNGTDVVQTDADGSYELTVDDQKDDLHHQAQRLDGAGR